MRGKYQHFPGAPTIKLTGPLAAWLTELTATSSYSQRQMQLSTCGQSLHIIHFKKKAYFPSVVLLEL